MRVLLLALLLPLAGCAAPASDLAAAGAEDALTIEPRDPAVTSLKVASLLARPVGEPDAGARGAFDVPEGATGLVVEARWTCSTPGCGYSLEITGRNFGEADGTGEARIEIEDPKPGASEAALVSNGPAANMQGEIRVSVLTGTPIQGFSAFDP